MAVDPKAPSFRFYPSDFLTGTLMYSAEEVGVYIRLLCQQWEKGPLPNDLDDLARAGGVSRRRMGAILDRLGSSFGVRPDGARANARLELERQKQDEYRKRQADHGKHGGRPTLAAPERVAPEIEKGSLSKPERVEKPTREKTLSFSSSLSSPSGEKTHPSGERRAPLQGGGAGAGTNPRDHLRHSWCSERMCVPDFIHAQLVRQRGTSDAEAWLKDTWYPAVIARYDGTPIGLPPEKFWTAEFAAEFTVSRREAVGERAMREWLQS